MFYIAQYPVRWTAESALHFTPWQTSSFRHHQHSSHAAIMREDYSLTFPPPSIARYSSIQPSELGRRGENENAQTLKVDYCGSPLLCPFGSRRTVHSSIVPNGENIVRTSFSEHLRANIPRKSFRSSTKREAHPSWTADIAFYIAFFWSSRIVNIIKSVHRVLFRHSFSLPKESYHFETTSHNYNVPKTTF